MFDYNEKFELLLAGLEAAMQTGDADLVEFFKKELDAHEAKAEG